MLETKSRENETLKSKYGQEAKRADGLQEELNDLWEETDLNETKAKKLEAQITRYNTSFQRLANSMRTAYKGTKKTLPFKE